MSAFRSSSLSVVALSMCGVLSLALPHAAMAQSAPASAAAPVPGAGDVLRDLPPATPPKPDASAAPVQGAAQIEAVPDVRFVLQTFDLQGATVLSAQQIAAVAEPWLGKPMGERELGALIGALRQRYDDAGYTLVVIGFPTQDVSGGVLHVRVVEPRLAQLQAPLGADAPISNERVQGMLSFFDVKPGGLLNTRALERVMFGLNDMPGVQAKASLSPAGDEGVYNVTIKGAPRRSWDASIGVDNQGVKYAGRWRATGMVRLNDPLHIGDNLDLQSLLSTQGGVKVGRVAYELPVAYTPARLSAAYALVDYSLGGQFAALDAHGTARVFETNLSYPLLRSRSRTVMARVGTESKQLKDEYFDTIEDVRSDKHSFATLAGLNVESRDNVLGGGFNGASATLYWGHLRFDTAANRDQDAARGDARTGGGFGKVELQLSRLQALTHDLSFYGSLGQQLASRNLDPAEKMSLGGPRGVRAYPTSEGASDEATLFTSELRYWLNANFTVFALYDWARGRKIRDPLPQELEGNDVLLHGEGLGLVASHAQWGSLKATLAWRGKRRSETETGDDKVRLFVQAQHAF